MEVEWEETPEVVRLRSPSLILEFDREPWGYRVKSASGRTLLEEYTYGVHKIFFPVYPLGVLQDGGTPHIFESFHLRPDEHLYGLGEQFGPLSKRGYRIDSWNVDTTLTTSKRSYINIPFLLSSYGFGIFIHSGAEIVYELGSDSYVSYSFEVAEDQLDIFFLYGPDLKDVIARYTELTGKPGLPPAWSFGLWMSRCMYRTQQEVEEIARRLREERIPCDVLHIDPTWMREGYWGDFVWDRTAFPHPEEMIEKLEAQGFKVCLWEQPYVPVRSGRFREGAEKGYFVRDEQGKILTILDIEQKPVAIVDFTHPEAVKWHQEAHRPLLSMGVKVFKTDMGEAVPDNARFANGKTGIQMHNVFALLYNKAVFEVCQEILGDEALVWGRSGYAGSQRYPANWTGDSHSTFDDLLANLRAGLSLSLSGIPFWSHDVGGFQGPPPSPRLYVRWAQVGFFSPLVRCHGLSPREPWVFGPEALRIFRKYAELRYRLLPYILTYAREAARTGCPLVRPVLLEFPQDPLVRELDTQFFFGREILVAPVLNPDDWACIYLPEGWWMDFWTDHWLKGPQFVERKVPLEELPLYIRGDSILPLGPILQYVGQRSDKPSARRPRDPASQQGQASKRQREQALAVHVYLVRRAEFNLDDGCMQGHFEAELTDEGCLLILPPNPKGYRVYFHGITAPERVQVNGRDLHRSRSSELKAGEWSFQRGCVTLALPPATDALRVDLLGAQSLAKG